MSENAKPKLALYWAASCGGCEIAVVDIGEKILDVADAFEPGDHLSTFGGNPVSCAAALANIDALADEKLCDASTERGQQFMDGLAGLKEKCQLVGDVRGKGLMIGIELVKDADRTPASDEAKAVRKLCREKGVLVGCGGVFYNVVRLQPPLTISEGQVQRTIEALSEALLTIAK